ncbi:uncharacterized protein E0L32_010661 [Thyridium curvatum]|uniref:Protein-serine/threonine kinase n=1 Tax=Thyridium curvatum TaxID=1093900 RepID=A0A507AJY4_9PEZI|nr:uncharacterized protein E0L32_010661 [Thyridium curvatum]TPX07663.1 hypothetical protein E0L32_010661 [Thyridium curvatum]
MPTYIVTCKDDATPEQVAAAKKHATDQGGKIGHEYALIKGFSVTFPEDSVATLEKHEHVKAVEKDQEQFCIGAREVAGNADMRPLAWPSRPFKLITRPVSSSRRLLSSAHAQAQHKHHQSKSRPHRHGSAAQESFEDDVPRLAKQRLHPLSLADLVRHGRPPLNAEALLQSANFSLSLIPIRLAKRLQALRNLPYIVVSNPHISKIYNNYQHSLSTLLPWRERTISTLDDEIAFTEVLAELVATHQDTIPVLAQGFLECRRYINPNDVTAFLDEHLRARIGTRLIAEQHIALHFSSKPFFSPEDSPTPCPEHPTYIGVIDTALRPAQTIDSCGGFVADICELKYGVRPRWVIDGEPDTTFAFVPMHLEYIVTELLKNAFRAVVENKMHEEPVVITIAPEPPDAVLRRDEGPVKLDLPSEDRGAFQSGRIRPLDDNAPGVTIRIRDRGGGISPEVLPSVWSYSFTTFSEHDEDASGGDGLNVIASASNGQSSIAGLGYGLPLSRAYAEYFGGGIAVQSLYGWGTDVYLRLKGVGKIE